MDESLVVVIAVAGYILPLIWVIFRMSRGLEASFPPEVIEVIRPLVKLLEQQAAKTPSDLDDQAVEMLKKALGLAVPEVVDTPAEG